MRKSQTQQLGSVISQFLKEMRIERKLKEVGIVSQWESMMGRMIASRTEKIYIRNRVLYIHITSSVMKNELLMMRQEIMSRINENAGETLIDLIVIK